MDINFKEMYGENTSFLKSPLQIRDVATDSGATFEVEHAENSETDDSDDERTSGKKPFDKESDLSQFFFELSTDSDFGHKDHWSKKTFLELEKTMTPITPDKGVFKKVIKEGYGPIVPEKSQVTVNYNMFLEKNTEPFDSTYLRSLPARFIVSEGPVVSGINIGVSTMRKGESSHFLIKPEYAFGKMGCPPRIPAMQTIFVTIEMQTFIEGASILELNSKTGEEETKASFAKVMAVCRSEHKAGNAFHNEKDPQRAIKRYMIAINLLEKLKLANEEEEKECEKLLIKLYANSAISCLKCNRPEMAITLSRKILRIDANHIKALFACGKAMRILHDFKEARIYLEKASRKNRSSEIAEELRLLDQKEQAYKQAERNFCSNIFGNKKIKDQVAEKNVQAKSEGEMYVSEQIKETMLKSLLEFKNNPKAVDLPIGVGFTVPELEYIKQMVTDLGLAYLTPAQGDVKLKVVKVVSEEP